MKKYISILCMLATVMLTACSNDDDVVEKTVMDYTMFQGQWFSEDNNTYLNLGYTAFNGVVYIQLETSLVEGEILNGTWKFYPANNMIRMTIHYDNAKFTENRDFKVLMVNGSSMKLLDTELNAEYIYHKVVETRSMMLGEDYDISISNFNATSYLALSPEVAAVSGGGRVKTHDEGTAYVKATLGATSYFVRIDVGSRIDSYYNELLNMTIDEVKERYGIPDFEGPSDTPNMVISYTTNISDRKLNYIHYRYDAETRQVTQIQTIYVTPEDYEAGVIDLQNKYYDVLSDGSIYGEYEWVLNNDYYIQPFVNGDYHVILYYNYSYQNAHGYY